jgi:hypothetical protein
VNSQDEGIGEVNDLVTDRSGKILAALIGVGGFLGIGEKDVAVRFEDLKLARDENNNVKIVLNISKETLASAPDYKLLGEQPVVEGSAKSDATTPQDLLEPRGSSAEARWPKGRRACSVLERDLVVELLVEGAAAPAARSNVEIAARRRPARELRRRPCRPSSMVSSPRYCCSTTSVE